MPRFNWIGFIFGIIFMFLGIFLLVPPKEEEDTERDQENAMMKATELWLKRQSTIKAEGVSRLNVARFFMTGTARMYDKEFFEKMRAKRYKKAANVIQSTKKMSTKETELVKEIYKSCVVAEKMTEKEKELTKILNTHDGMNEEEKAKAQELMASWKQSKEDFKMKDDKILRMMERMRTDEDDSTGTKI